MQKQFTKQDLYRAAKRGEDFSQANADTVNYDTIELMIDSEFNSTDCEEMIPLERALLFVSWYSGMGKPKIVKAYERFLAEHSA